MSVQHRPREHDEQLLYILKLRQRYGAVRVADHLGLASAQVRTICNRIVDDDVKCSTKDGIESKGQVMAGYWRK